MSDFEAALERLLTDPDFVRALAANPAAALAGYQLSTEELGVLTRQITRDNGGGHAVEARTNQSSLAGLLSPLTAAPGASGDLLGQEPDTPASRGLGAAPERGLGAAPETGAGGEVGKRGVGPAPQVPEGYATRVDVDGDGSWDPHTLHAAPGGEVEIHVDHNGDGQADFVGHDTDADGLVNWSEYDKDRDGQFETRMYDDTGDGWMDRTETDKSG